MTSLFSHSQLHLPWTHNTFYNDQTLLNATGKFHVNKIKTVIVVNFCEAAGKLR
jgi:hypothetical protein